MAFADRVIVWLPAGRGQTVCATEEGRTGCVGRCCPLGEVVGTDWSTCGATVETLWSYSGDTVELRWWTIGDFGKENGMEKFGELIAILLEHSQRFIDFWNLQLVIALGVLGFSLATTERGGWWSVEPGLGGMVDELADRLDLHGTPEPGSVPRVAAGIHKRADRLKAIGNGQVPAAAQPTQ